MNSEFDALLRNQTWELVPPSRHLNVIGCRWIFKIKRKVDGSIERYKARLVAKGYHQQLEVDFHETYSPVVNLQPSGLFYPLQSATTVSSNAHYMALNRRLASGSPYLLLC
jgi:hypothetical protein